MRAAVLALTVTVGALACVIGLGGNAVATTTGVASKTAMITIVITPSPVAFAAPKQTGPMSVAAVGFDWSFARFVRFLGGSTTGFAAHGERVVAVTQTPVPVSITVKPDPTSQFLHINNPAPGSPSTFTAGYGANTLSCAYQVYAYFPTKLGTSVLKNFTVYDYVYGSAYGGSGTFPTYDGPTLSLLSWGLDGASAPGPYTPPSTYTPFYNSGTTGQLTYTGVPGAAATLCVDLSLTVPNTVAAGTYTVPITYSIDITY